MYYAEDLVEEVRSRTDIVDLISGYVRLSKRGVNHIGLCPFHNEKTPSFTVSQSKQIFHCFGCGSGGNAFTFLMKYENMGFADALKVLADKAGVVLPKVTDERARKFADQRTKLTEINREAAVFYHNELIGERGAFGLSYLKERGLSDKTIKTFGLGYSPKGFGALYKALKEKGFDDESLKLSALFSYRDEKEPSDRFWNRVMFPIIDVSGKVIGFGGRVMGDGKPKYLNSSDTPVFNKGRNLFALNFAKLSREAFLIICEGYMDVITLHQAGFTNAIASLGTALTQEQARLISKYTKTVLLMYDSDEAGIKAILKAIPILKEAGIVSKIVNLKPYKDPDEFLINLGEAELRKRLHEAVSSFEFELKIGEKEHDISIPEERLSLIRKMAERIIDIENSLERENYLSMLAERYNISTEVLRESVNKLGLQRETRLGYEESKERIKARKERKGEDGDVKSERLLISMLTDYPELYLKAKAMISPEDFSNELTRMVARALFSQIEADGKGKPALLINLYDTETEQQEVASLFGEDTFSDRKSEDFKKAFTETIRKVKLASLDRQMGELTENGDMMRLLEIVKEQKRISEIKMEL